MGVADIPLVGCTRTHLQVVPERGGVHPQEPHAGSGVAETASPQVDVEDTRQLLHLAVAHVVPVRPQQVEVDHGTLLVGV